ncbi:MAG: HEAT repeat domain-containing protein, partial [Anaerolineae bacterium]
MRRKDQPTKEEKIEHLKRIIESEDYSTDYLPVLKGFMGDEDPEVRELAISALWDYLEPEMIDPLFDKAKNDPSQEVCSQAIITLGRYIYEGDLIDYDFDWGMIEPLMQESELSERDFLRVKAFLLQIARDEEESLDSRRFAIEALGFLIEPEILDLIAEAYAHPDVRMKASAIFAMGRGGSEQWAEIILKELDSSVEEIQYEAIRAAGEASLSKAAPRLKQLALSDNKDLRLEAIWALGKTGGRGVSQFLESCAQEEDEDIREVAEAALEEM